METTGQVHALPGALFVNDLHYLLTDAKHSDVPTRAVSAFSSSLYSCPTILHIFYSQKPPLSRLNPQGTEPTAPRSQKHAPTENPASNPVLSGFGT